MHAVHMCDLLLQMYSVVRDCLQGGPKNGAREHNSGKS